MRELLVDSGSAADGRRLSLALRWTRDRYQGELSVVAADGQRQSVWQTVEGPSDAAWPPSPPIQQISLHENPSTRPAVLGVGMAGTGHWSLSIEPDARLPRIVWDVAHRARAAPERLENRFSPSVAPPAGWAPARAPGGGTTAVFPGDLCLDLLATAGQPELSWIWLPQEQEVCIRVATTTFADTVSRWPATIRWRFQWRLATP